MSEELIREILRKLNESEDKLDQLILNNEKAKVHDDHKLEQIRKQFRELSKTIIRL
jgi:hypothetical protein